MGYDKSEIQATYDNARALAPETRRLWQDLLSMHIDRAEVSLVIDLTEEIDWFVFTPHG